MGKAIEARMQALLPEPDEGRVLAPYLDQRAKPGKYRLQVDKNRAFCSQRKVAIDLDRPFRALLSCDERRQIIALELWQEERSLQCCCQSSGSTTAAHSLRILLGDLSVPVRGLSEPLTYPTSFLSLLAKVRARMQALGGEDLGLLPGNPTFLVEPALLKRVLSRVDSKRGFPMATVRLPPMAGIWLTITLSLLLAGVVNAFAGGVWGLVALFMALVTLFGLLGQSYVRVENSNIIVTTSLGFKKYFVASDALQFVARKLPKKQAKESTEYGVFMMRKHGPALLLTKSLFEDRAIELEAYLDHSFGLRDEPVEGELWRKRAVGYADGRPIAPSLPLNSREERPKGEFLEFLDLVEPNEEAGTLLGGVVRWNEDGVTLYEGGEQRLIPYDTLALQLSRTTLKARPTRWQRLFKTPMLATEGLLIELRTAELKLFAALDSDQLRGLSARQIASADRVRADAALELLQCCRLAGAKLLI